MAMGTLQQPVFHAHVNYVLEQLEAEAQASHGRQPMEYS